MGTQPTSVIGREPELATARQFVRDAAEGPSALVLEGTAGIGKTAIWSAAVAGAEADGVAVRVCRCGESDSAWAFAGLGDLLEGLDPAAMPQLPAVQQRALAATLLLADGDDRTPGQRVVGVAVLGVLRHLTRSGPLLLAIDDVQWLDPSTRSVLSFALRRLVDEPVRLLVSCRTGPLADPEHRADPAGLGLPGQRVVVGPVSIGVLQRIVSTQIGQGLSRPTLTRLHQATGGNPMMCLEMARALRRRGQEPGVGEPLPVPADLRALVTDRLRPLGAPTRRLLLIAAALARPTVGAITAVMTGPGTANGATTTATATAGADPDVAARALSEAVGSGLLTFEGERVHFTHPLIASVPYADLSPTDRRALHEQLAASVGDPEEHARHAALGSLDRRAAVADALELAAAHARRRGSLDAAAELAELAVGRTPLTAEADLLRRTVDAAEYLFLLGETARARTLLRGGLDAVAPGPARVRGLLLAANIDSWERGDATVAEQCGQALSEAGGDPMLTAQCYATLAETCPSGPVEDLFHAERTVELLDAVDPAPADLLSTALANVAVHRCRLGRGLAVDLLERAAALEADGTPMPVNARAALSLGMYLKVVDRFDESRAWLHTVRTAALDEGDDSALPNVLGHLAILECWAGDFALALPYAIEGRERGVRTGLRSPMATSAHVLTLAYLGRLAEARDLGRADLALDESLGFNAAAALHHRSLAITELLAGDHARAADHGLRAVAISVDEVGVLEPAIMRVHADTVTALVALGRVDEARALTAQLDVSTGATHQPWSTALAARCHGQLAAAAGDGPAALAHLAAAVTAHRALPMPFEEARTRMVLAGLLRRSGHRGDARGEYEAAGAGFARLGAAAEAAHARVELASLGGRTANNELTAVERRVADLVGAGQTNREVAAALFMSVRTVESHLVRIYRKLGLRSRTELSVHVQAATGETPPA